MATYHRLFVAAFVGVVEGAAEAAEAAETVEKGSTADSLGLVALAVFGLAVPD